MLAHQICKRARRDGILGVAAVEPPFPRKRNLVTENATRALRISDEMLRFSAGFLAARAGFPTLAEARKECPPVSFPSDTRLLWGPISKEVARIAGMWVPCSTSSVLLRPRIPDELRQAVLREVPTEVLPRPDDDKYSLAARLAASDFLEDSHVLKNGCGPARVRLNATTMAQPRRRSWSLLVDAGHDDDDGGGKTRKLMNYTIIHEQ